MSTEEQEEMALNFMPQLAQVLGLHERDKGAPLTEEEVLEITDNAVCIAMRKSDYDNMIRHREYRDIDPEDAWADWHRMRSWLVGGYLPAFIFTILCSADAADVIREQAGAGGSDAGVIKEQAGAGGSDAGVIKEQAGAGGSDTGVIKEQAGAAGGGAAVGVAADADDAVGVADDDGEWQAEILDCNEEIVDSLMNKLVGVTSEQRASLLQTLSSDCVVVDLVGPFFGSHQAFAAAKGALQLVERCFAAGAKAVCCESSYITHSQADWLECAKNSLSDDESTAKWALLEAFVQCPIVRENDFITCGMHLLGLPDLIISHDDASQIEEGGAIVDDNVRRLFYSFAGYILTECDSRPFRSGNTFSLAPDSRRYRVVWEPCSEFEEGNILYNPFGYRRFTV